MRKEFAATMLQLATEDDSIVFITGDLGYAALETLQGNIAPFIVYRCLEQFRNDVCFHNLPVFLVGNGGGYGYGIMGSSHHTLEDIACLSGLQNANVWVPAFADEVEPVIRQIVSESRPAYLRLGFGKNSPENSYSSGSFKVIHQGDSPEITIFALGPIANNVMTALEQSNELASKVNVIN
eukprot:gene3532-4540_t